MSIGGAVSGACVAGARVKNIFGTVLPPLSYLGPVIDVARCATSFVRDGMQIGEQTMAAELDALSTYAGSAAAAHVGLAIGREIGFEAGLAFGPCGAIVGAEIGSVFGEIAASIAGSLAAARLVTNLTAAGQMPRRQAQRA